MRPRNSSFAGVASVASRRDDPVQAMLTGAQDNAQTTPDYTVDLLAPYS